MHTLFYICRTKGTMVMTCFVLFLFFQHVGTLRITTTMQPHSPNYQITYLYSDIKRRKHTQEESKTTVASWFTEDGTLLVPKFDDFIKTSVDSVAKRLHKDQFSLVQFSFFFFFCKYSGGSAIVVVIVDLLSNKVFIS